MGMSQDDQEFCLRMAEFSNRIAFGINHSSAQGKALKASELLLRRMVNSCNSIMVLVTHSQHDCRVDIGTVLRAIYDAMLQCQYILLDPRLQEERAGLYLDFQWIERKRMIEGVAGNKSQVADRLRNSPRRAQNGPSILAEISRVAPQFLDKKRKGKLRPNWYEGTLRDLARTVGYEDEYGLMQRELSALTHTSPLAVDSPQPGPDFSRAIAHAWFLSLRPLRAIAGLAGVILTKDEEGVLAGMAKSLV